MQSIFVMLMTNTRERTNLDDIVGNLCAEARLTHAKSAKALLGGVTNLAAYIANAHRA